MGESRLPPRSIVLLNTPLWWGVLACSGCKAPTASWAIDPMFLLPTEDAVRGTQTWQVYTDRWRRKFSERHYLCSVVVDFEAIPTTTDCEGCVVAFDVAPARTDTDCGEALAIDPLFEALGRIGVGPLSTGGPYPDASSTGYADYGNGWEVHGWAHPEAIAHQQPTASFTWDGREPFAFSPTGAWELGLGASGGTEMSRSAPLANPGTP